MLQCEYEEVIRLMKLNPDAYS